MPRRRESISCCPREQEEKENGKDPNWKTRKAQLRSPGISKGTKNFMSPTISAASKFNASPRKKLLSERNGDMIHSSSTSLSDPRSSCTSVNILEHSEEPEAKMKKEASRDCLVTDSEVGPEDSFLSSKGSRKKVAFDSVVHEIPPVETTYVGAEADLVNVNEEFVNQKSPCSSLLAPLDADPLVPLPPYDPKMNYLSPRPQFLHYRPSQRLKCYVGEEGRVSFGPLEDGSDLEGLSYTDVTTDETSLSEEESGDASSNEAAKQEEGPESKPDDPKISEEPAVEMDDAVDMEESVGAQELSKRSFFTRSMFIISIFITIVTSSAMVGTHYFPIGGDLTIKGPSFPLEAQHLRDSVAENMKLWYANSSYYLSSLVLDFRGKEHEWYELQYYNLTDLDENPWLGKNGIFGSPIHVDGFGNLEIGNEEDEKIEYSETEEDVVAENAADEGAEVPGDEPKEEEAAAENEVDEGAEIPGIEPKGQEENHQIMDRSLNTEPDKELEILHADMEELITDTKVKLEMEFAAENHEAPQAAKTECIKHGLLEVKVKNQPMAPYAEVTSQPDLPRVEVQVEVGVYDPSQEQGSIILKDHHTAAFSVNSESSEIANSSGMMHMAGVFVALFAAFACHVYAREKKTSAGVPGQDHTPVQKPLVAKKCDISPVTANCVTEFGVTGVDSCPSEMTSFQKNVAASCSEGMKTGLGKSNEAQSCERKTASLKSLRSESTASSFSDLSLDSSPSYGSFTTYEMIPNKHVC